MQYLKTVLMMTALTVPFVWVGREVGGHQGALLALLVAIATNAYSYWFGDRMVLRCYRAREINPEHSSGVYQIVARLANQANLPMPRVYILPEYTPNAFATGRSPNHAAVAATIGIVTLLTQDELEGVLAHEIAHIRHRDILPGTLAATFAAAIVTATRFGKFAPGGDPRNRSLLRSLVVLLAGPFIAMIIRFAVSREHEFAADSRGAEISGKPLALASALEKLQYGVHKYPLKGGNPAHAHLFTVNPFFFGSMQKLFATHPPTAERIKRLQAISAYYRRNGFRKKSPSMSRSQQKNIQQ